MALVINILLRLRMYAYALVKTRLYLLRLAVPDDLFVPDIKILSDAECCNARKSHFSLE